MLAALEGRVEYIFPSYHNFLLIQIFCDCLIPQVCLTHYHIMPHFDTFKKYSVENNVKKNACNKQFLLFPQCSLPCMVLIFRFKST